MKKLLLLLLAYASLGVITIFASIVPASNSNIGGSGSALMLSADTDEVVPKNNSPDYNPAIYKAAVGNLSFADKKSIVIPQLMETNVIVSGENIDAKNMMTGCKNHGYLYAIAS